MRKLANFLVERRIWAFVISVIVAICSLVAMNFVTVNEDMTKYLPKDSAMRKGLDIMQEQFPAVAQLEGFKLMFEGLTEEEKDEVKSKIASFEGVSAVKYIKDSQDYNKGEYSLFVVTAEYISAEKTDALVDDITTELKKDYTVYSYYANTEDSILGLLIPIALTMFVLVMAILSKSYIEILLLLASIGFSIIINMGTNIIFPSISDMTLSIVAVLQLVLSIDYSVMLFHRYEQERKVLEGKDNEQAMKNAIKNSFNSLFSSAFTTIVGLLVLLFMSFTIGADMGLVMAKGILCSLICVFTVMPTLILWCDKLLQVTNKAYLRERRKMRKEGKANVG